VDPRTLFHDVADTMACKASVRFGDRLSREEAVALLRESGALDRAFVCPHGRPTVWRIPFSELRRRFGR
jgi:DNA mismatch repair protein MutL